MHYGTFVSNANAWTLAMLHIPRALNLGCLLGLFFVQPRHMGAVVLVSFVCFAYGCCVMRSRCAFRGWIFMNEISRMIGGRATTRCGMMCCVTFLREISHGASYWHILSCGLHKCCILHRKHDSCFVKHRVKHLPVATVTSVFSALCNTFDCCFICVM